RWHFDEMVGEREHYNLFPDLAQKHCQSVSRIGALQLRTARERRSHRAGNIHQHDSLSRQLLGRGYRLQHGLLERLFPLRGVTRRRDEAEREHRRSADLAKSTEHERLVHSGLPHVAQVTEQRQRTQFLLAKQALPGLTLVGTR